jgi:hypothetical protein
LTPDIAVPPNAATTAGASSAASTEANAAASSGGPLSNDGTFQIARTDFSDGRPKGNYVSRYTVWAWVQIVFEGLYLFSLIAVCGMLILILVWHPDNVLSALRTLLHIPLGETAAKLRALQLWLIVLCAGVLGGTSSAVKWLYHTISWDQWNHDRIVWRLSVPVLAGLMAVFTGCMVMSGIIPLLTKELFSHVLSCAGFGFFVGLFADNFIAALQKFATRLLGTLGKGA